MNATKPKTIASWPPLAQPEPAWATDRLLLCFVTKVNEAPSGCWEWQAARDARGYGRIRVNRTSPGAHRVAYRLYKGEIPDGMHVCHSCDNPACVNPDHLWLGTGADNVQDKVNKGRQNKGMNHGNAKFTPEVVEAVREARAKHGTAYRKLGKQFGMSEITARRYCNDPEHRKYDAPLGGS